MSSVNEPLHVCSSCLKAITKVFVRFHKSPLGGDTTKKRRKYSDETGRLWHGTKCPDCASKWRRDQAQKEINEKQAELKKKLEG